MQHLARCLLCLPGSRTNVPSLIYEVTPCIWSSCRANHRSRLPALNAAACFKGPSRVFYRTRRPVTHPPLQLTRDPQFDESLQTSDFESDKRDHDAIFAALRTHLLRPERPAKAVVDLLKQHFLRCSEFTVLDLNRSERAILIEILRKVLDEWSQWKGATSSTYVSPANILAFFARYGVLEPQDWALCLNSLALTALEAFSTIPLNDLDQRLQRQFDTFLLVRQLLRAWKLFFYCHSRKRHNVYEVLYTDRLGVWPLLQPRTLPTTLRDRSSQFNMRLLSFAPEWGSDGESFADQQLICASMMSIVAVSQSIGISTSSSILLPSVMIDWEMSTISPPGLGESKNATAGPAESQQTSPEPGDAPSVLSSDELSMLFIVAHALNSQSINLTLLRVSLAKMVPENRIGRIMSIFSEFRSRVPDLLSHTLFEQGNTVDSLISDSAEHGVPTLLVTDPVRHEPLDTLLQKVIASRTIAEVESLKPVYSSLRQRNPRIKLRDLHMAFYKKYCELGSSDQEREFWNAFPMLHIPKDFWTLKLDFYFERNDIAAFEDGWLGMIEASHAASAADWCKKLQLYFNCGRFRTALEHFYVLLGLSSRSNHPNSSVFSPLAQGAIVTVETFNLMIRNLLEIDEVSLAEVIEFHLHKDQHIEANAATYALFFSYWIERGKTELAKRYLKKSMEASPPSDFAPYFKLIRYSLQQWPRGAPWADVHLVMERFDDVLGSKYVQNNVLRRISLVADSYGGSYKIKVSPIPGSDMLSFETEKGIADVLTERIPMRAETPMSPAVEALRTDFVSLMSAIAEEYPNPEKARLMLISWTYCRLQGLPILREVEDCLRTQLSQLPFQQQLRLLGGDVYQRSRSAGYGNFAYVRTHFGPEFAVRRLEGLGLGRYGPLIRKLPWLGFTSYNDRILLENGMTSARARTLFLDAMNDLYHDLETIRKEEESEFSQRMATKEGIWYLSDAIIDNSGSLRKIPFISWEPAPKRQATTRFKMAAAVPKLLGGEKALRRMKQRMLSKGRKSLTRGGKGLVARPLRAQLLRRRRRRHFPSLYQRWDVALRHLRDPTRLRHSPGPSAESKKEAQAIVNVRGKADVRHAIRGSPAEQTSIAIPETPFRSTIISDGDKTTSTAQSGAQQGRTSSLSESENKDANTGVTPLLEPGQLFRYKRY